MKVNHLAILCSVAFTPVLASNSAAAGQRVFMPAPVQTVLRTGTPIALRLAEPISTKEKVAKANDRVRLEVAEAVMIGGVDVIPVGSPAVGELTDVRNKGM